MNYFIEGIQGSGKTTMLEKMTQDNPKLKAYREGDFSPVELAWCAYVSHSQYEIIIKKYANLAGEIKKNTVKEGEMYIITYTRIITDIPDFHKELEQYEIYNGLKSKAEFEEIVLSRFTSWSEDNQLFECSIFQNIIENQILYLQMGQCLKERTDYAKNDEKTEAGQFVSSYECDPSTVDLEFEITKNQYAVNTGRNPKEKDVIAYQIRQSFKPGETTPEEANQIGYETAMRWTKGKHAFIVATHVDKAHIHNHIVYNSTTLDAQHKYKNFFLSSFSLRRLSDLICLEHGLSVIPEKKPGEWQNRTTYPKKETKRDDIRNLIDSIFERKRPDSFDEFLRALEGNGYEVKRGKYISVKGKEQKNFLRLRSLGNGYTEKDIEKRIAGEVIDIVSDDPRNVIAGKRAEQKTEKKVDTVLDIQSIIAKNKGPGYERWAKLHNIKAISKTLIFLSEKGLGDYEKLSEAAKEATDKFDYLSARQKEIEARLAEIKALRQHIFNYSKSRKIYMEYKTRKFDANFFEEHREPLTLYQAAKDAFKKYDGPIPTIRELDAEFQKLVKEKNQIYSEFKIARTEMMELLSAKQNVEHFLGEQNRLEQDIQKKKGDTSL